MKEQKKLIDFEDFTVLSRTHQAVGEAGKLGDGPLEKDGPSSPPNENQPLTAISKQGAEGPSTSTIIPQHASGQLQTTLGVKERVKEQSKKETQIPGETDYFKSDQYQALNGSQKRKRRILHHYSKGAMKCACCGEKNIEFLSINHLEGGGIAHQEKLRKKGTTLYAWLIKKHFPEGYNVLCFNCNHAQGHYEKCPHERVIEPPAPEVIEIGDISRQSFDYINRGSKNFDSIPSEKDMLNWHRSHRNYFGFEYSGPHPTRGGTISHVGRYHTTPQARFEYPEYKTLIFALGHALKVWVKHPGGIKTVDQFVNARRTARTAVSDFARKHGIIITKEKGAGFSEHTVENKALSRFLDPLLQEEPDLCRTKLGLTVNLTSHKKKKEWTDREWAPGKSRAKDRVMGLEYILDHGAPPVLIEHMEHQDKWMDTIMKGQTTQHQEMTVLLGSMGQFVKASNTLAELVEKLLSKEMKK